MWLATDDNARQVKPERRAVASPCLRVFQVPSGSVAGHRLLCGRKEQR